MTVNVERAESWRPTGYRGRVLNLLSEELEGKTFNRALDFGAGDGWFGLELVARGIVQTSIPVEVKLRPDAIAPPVLFDGQRLPFASRAFDLVFAVDVIHHCMYPDRALEEMARCSSDYLLLKDHTYATRAGRLLLAVFDELGNRRFGIPSPGKYQREWEWDSVIRGAGFERVGLRWPATTHSGLLGFYSNHLQFVSLWRRV